MKRSVLRSCVSLVAITSITAFAVPAFAQDAAAAPATEEAQGDNDDIVVTAVSRGQNKLDTSISVSSLNSEAIAAAAPRSLLGAAAQSTRSVDAHAAAGQPGEEENTRL